MLASPRLLRDGKIAVDVGGAYNISALTSAVSDRPSGSTESDTILRAAITQGATPSGPLTYVAGRGGFGEGNEGSIALIGRVVRIGARRQLFSRRTFVLTGGLAGRFAYLSGNFASDTPRITNQDARVYGADLSLAAAYTQRDGFDLWAGLRVGYLYNTASFVIAPGVDALESRTWTLGAHRLELSLHLGGRVLLGRFAVALELESTLAYATGNAQWSGGNSAQSGILVGFTPAGALSYSF
jgi:hypothetical protein